MNRIIIIGNGFDLAHNLKTGYKDFIDDYWNTVREKIYGGYWQLLDQQYGMFHSLNDYDDKFVNIKTRYGKDDTENEYFSYKEGSPLGDLCTLITKYNSSNTTTTAYLKFKNIFFERISSKCSLTDWVDIENEYYAALKDLLLEKDSQKQSKGIQVLNKEFDDVKGLLEAYLTKIIENADLNLHQSIQNAFSSFLDFDDIANCKQNKFVDSIFSAMNARDDYEFMNDMENNFEYNKIETKSEKQMHFFLKKHDNISFKKNYLMPYTTLILNFNYTKTAEKLYTADNGFEIINIHGELNNENNPIIFGYGDELDSDYKTIEELQNNYFLENIKSIKYHQTRNYRNLLNFISSEPYQVFVMGHSCGNSDRTLLNTLFEHNNCLSIKVFYYQFKDTIEGVERYFDNYSDVIKNISRNFNNKPNMRDILVNKEDCSPLVPVKEEAAE
jgi:hypothetical protein